MSNASSIYLQFALLVFLLLLSAFFSGTETALMTLNRYRLRHKARAGHRGARIVEQLLKRPDRLIGLILLGNNLVNILAASLTTIIALRIGGESLVAAAALVLTVVVLLFAEVTPKTLAALQPERVAWPAGFVYLPLLKILYPVVWVLNSIANGILWLLGVSPVDQHGQALSSEELRTVVVEAGSLIPHKHQRMLVNILDLEKVTVADIMVPRNEVVGIDLNDDIDDIVTFLENTPHTRLPIYQDSLDNIIGVLHVRKLIKLMSSTRLEKSTLREIARDAYFVPEGTPLNVQLLNFQQTKKRFALVVDEYGDIQGLVALEDILEEIVGEFTSVPVDLFREVHRERDGSFVVNGAANVRELNRSMNWSLPTDGPKTINGLILEMLETIPKPGTRLEVGGYLMEIMLTADNAVKTVRVRTRDSG